MTEDVSRMKETDDKKKGRKSVSHQRLVALSSHSERNEDVVSTGSEQHRPIINKKEDEMM